MRKLSKILAVVFCMLMLLSSLGAVSLAASKNPAATKKISTSVTATSIKLTWSKVKGASGYRVYQYKDKKWVTVKKSTTGNTYTASSLKPATSYKFAVKTYKKSGSKTYWSDSKKITVKTAAVSNPKSVKATALENCQVKLNWSKVSSAKGYVVYVYKDGAWKKLKSTTATSYTVSGLNAKTTYKFKVSAYMKVSGKYYYSSGKTASIKTSELSVGRINFVNHGVTSDTVNMTWNAEGNITGYRVFVLDAETQKYNTLATLKSSKITEYTATELAGSTVYSFSVRPYAKSGSTTVWGESYRFDARTLLAAPASISATISEQTATVLWTSAGGEDGYRVYLYDEDDEDYTIVVDSTTETTYTLTLPEKTMQKVGVKAYKKLEDGTYEWSSMKTITLGGVYKYKPIFDSNEFSYSTVLEGQETDIYFKNGSVHMRTVMPISDSVNADCRIIYNKQKDKTIALMSITGFGGFYCSDMSALGGEDIDMNQMSSANIRFSDSAIDSEITVAEVKYSDKTLIGEAYVDTNGNTVIYYFEDGELVRHDVVDKDGNLDSLVISNLKTSVSDKKFDTTPPLGYINIDMFM